MESHLFKRTIVLILMCSALFGCVSNVKERNPNSVEGSSWVALTNTNTMYIFEFQENEKLVFKYRFLAIGSMGAPSSSYFHGRGSWEQDGDLITLKTKNGRYKWLGTRVGGTIVDGRATSDIGEVWLWKARLR